MTDHLVIVPAGAPNQGPRPGAEADDASRAMYAALHATGPARQQALAGLYALLLRAARFELTRRRSSLPHLRDVEDLAVQSADDALVAVLGKLDRFSGQSRFTTWAYKFALLEASVKVRRRTWEGREIPLEAGSWPDVADARSSPHAAAEARELLAAIRDGVETRLTRHQREVFTALALNQAPIDVLADRLGTTRGALYKTLHDARRRLRARLAELGYALEDKGADR